MLTIAYEKMVITYESYRDSLKKVTEIVVKVNKEVLVFPIRCHLCRTLTKQILRKHYFRKKKIKINVLKNTCNTHLNNVKRNSSQQEHSSGKTDHWILHEFFSHKVKHFTYCSVHCSDKYMGGNQQPLCTGMGLLR